MTSSFISFILLLLHHIWTSLSHPSFPLHPFPHQMEIKHWDEDDEPEFVLIEDSKEGASINCTAETVSFSKEKCDVCEGIDCDVGVGGFGQVLILIPSIYQYTHTNPQPSSFLPSLRPTSAPSTSW